MNSHAQYQTRRATSAMPMPQTQRACGALVPSGRVNRSSRHNYQEDRQLLVAQIETQPCPRADASSPPPPYAEALPGHLHRPGLSLTWRYLEPIRYTVRLSILSIIFRSRERRAISQGLFRPIRYPPPLFPNFSENLNGPRAPVAVGPTYGLGSCFDEQPGLAGAPAGFDTFGLVESRRIVRV